MSKPQFWVVRVPKGQECIDAAKQKGLVAVRFGVAESLELLKNREDFKKAYSAANPEASEPKINVNGGQLFRFVKKIRPDDWILMPDRNARTLLFGIAQGDYLFQRDALGEGFSHARKVQWKGEIQRDSMSIPLKNSLGSLLTVVKMEKHESELARLVEKPEQPVPESKSGDEEYALPFYEETKSKADELIADLIDKLDPYQLQDLVAGLLQAMGYYGEQDSFPYYYGQNFSN